MHRRTILKSLGAGTGHVLFPSILSGFLVSCHSEPKGAQDFKPLFFQPDDLEIVKEMIDLIIPATRTASATQVLCHQFLDEVFAKCLEPEVQRTIKQGIQGIKADFNATEDKESFLRRLDQKAYEGDEGSAWFIPVKQYTLIGFFTSEEGETRASNYVPVPGDYQGDILLNEDTLNYGFTSLRYYL